MLGKCTKDTGPLRTSKCPRRLLLARQLALLARCSSDRNNANSAPDQRLQTLSSTDWQQKARRGARREVLSAGERIGMQPAVLESHLDVFESLLPSMHINTAQMKASDWARVVSDPELAAKLVALKTAFPRLNVESLLSKHPKILLWSCAKLQDNIAQVSPVFSALPRPEAVLDVLPELLDPRQCFSVVASLRKWYPQRDPLHVLQADPDVVRRAEVWDAPLEPVFFDAATRTWTAAGYSRAKQEEWQVYIEKELYKRKPQPIDKQEALVVGGGAAAAAAAAADTAAAVATVGAVESITSPNDATAAAIQGQGLDGETTTAAAAVTASPVT